MRNIIEGQLVAGKWKIAIVASRFNDVISQRLIDGALDCLKRHGVDESQCDIIMCPGAFEIPVIAKHAVATKKYHAVICLGAVIRGETPHFDYVAGEAAKGIAQVALNAGIPVIFGVLTTDSVEQAMDRSGLKSGNKGWEAALAAIEMSNLLQSISKKSRE